MSNKNPESERPVWTKEFANHWYKKYSWLCGCNFIPSTAINQLEMWQADTFDETTINRELSYAQSLGMNVMRVYLHHLTWQTDMGGFKKRVSAYLDIATSHDIVTIFVFFDDCWNPVYHAGVQPAPKTGVHNSGWVSDPGKLLYENSLLINTLEVYVKDVMHTFRNDERILLWDVYNEPGNSEYGEKCIHLLNKVFSWGRQINPSQPLSAGVWNVEHAALNNIMLENSDVITYHNYDNPATHLERIEALKKPGRPMLCTEYMARQRNSRFANILPLLKAHNIAAVNWGLVAGKTNTIYRWEKPDPSGEEPKTWFHDILRKDGTPYSSSEIKIIKSLTAKTAGVLM